MSVNLKNNLSKLRKEMGYTRQTLAEMLHVTPQTIISLECGKYNPSILLAFRISRIFNKQIEEIFIPDKKDLE